MWRNLKVSGKLSLGFGSIVLVFLVTVIFMRGSVATVQSTSRLLAEGVTAASEQVNKLNGQAYELFMAVRLLQFTESAEAISGYKAQLANVQNIIADVEALHSAQPALQGPAFVVKNTLPLAKEYTAIVDRQLRETEKKRSELLALRQEGQGITTTMEEFMTALHGRLKNRIQSGAASAELNALADAMSLGNQLTEDGMVLRRDIWEFVASFGADAEVRQDMVDRIVKMRQEVEGLDSLTAAFSEENRIIDALLTRLATYETNVAEFIKTCDTIHQINKTRDPVYAAFSDTVNEAAQLVAKRSRAISNSNVTELAGALRLMYAAAALTILFGVVIVIFISRSIAGPLSVILRLAKRAGDGDLTICKADFGYEGRDEMGSMVDALSDMLQSQNLAMKHFMKIAGSVSNGAGDLSADSSITSAAMDSVKTAVTQVSSLSESNGQALEASNAGVEELSAGADTVAQSATDSASFISQTTEASNKAVRTVNNVIEGMRNVGKNSRESEEKTRQLFTAVENVSGFVSVITSIADQTNLLALNAAIEAARAGEVGRGFAVVAEEVRKLAEESGRAAQNVNNIIQELQSGAQASIDATSEAGRLLNVTLKHAESALEELDGALGQMQKANDSIQSIAAIAEEQAASSKEVATAIDSATRTSHTVINAMSDISQATEKTTASTEHVSQKADDFMVLAHDLLESVAKFRVLTNGEFADEMLSKIQAHKEFSKKLFTMAETCQPVAIQINPRNCGLGIFMSTSTPPSGYEHWWETIHASHDKYHELGEKIIKVIYRKDKSLAEKRSEAMALAREGEALSRIVIKLIEDAAADIRSSSPKQNRRNKPKALMAGTR